MVNLPGEYLIMNASPTPGVDDYVDFIQEAQSPRVNRDAFCTIFTCMGQEQHYQWMMGTSSSEEGVYAQ